MTPRWSKTIALAALMAAFAVPAAAQAARISASISLMGPLGAAPTTPTAGSSVSFSVSATGVKQSDLYYLWVTNVCYQNGNVVYARDMPVQSPGLAGTAGPFALDWSGGGSAQCTAYVWMFPSSSKPLAGGSTSYTVNG